MAEPIANYLITSHAVEIRRRGIEENIVRRILAAPEQRHVGRPGRDVLQSRIALTGKTYLLRVFVDIDRDPAEVVTFTGRAVSRSMEGIIMKATYDARTDTLSIILRSDAAVAESDEDKPGVILDYDEDGNLVSLEILDASKRVTEARRIEFETVR